LARPSIESVTGTACGRHCGFGKMNGSFNELSFRLR
jgi:hypothetical protein